MAGLTFLDTLQTTITHDTYIADDVVKIQIDCPNRRPLGFLPIQGILVTDLSLSIKPKWEPVVSGALSTLGISKLVDGIDMFTQATMGQTITQPWFSRDAYKGTAALEFKIDFRLIADKDQGSEVVAEANRLMALCFSRKSGATGSLKEANSLIDLYYIPGPNPFYPIITSGDYLNISIGGFFFWEACYVVGLEGRVSSSLGPDGNPNYADISITFRTMDMQYVNGDGSFSAFKKLYTGTESSDALKKVQGKTLTEDQNKAATVG